MLWAIVEFNYYNILLNILSHWVFLADKIWNGYMIFLSRRLIYLWRYHCFFFFPSLFWVVMNSFFILYSFVKISSSSSRKAPCTITYFPAFFPGRFCKFTLHANFCCSILENPFNCSSAYFLGTINVYNPNTLVIFLLLAFSAIIWIPLNKPSLKS